jgi:lysophospholipase L1-like esterase
VLLGINDLGRGDGVPQVLERYERIILALQTAGMEVFVQSTLRCSARQCARYANRIPELNRGLEALAARRGARFIDLNTLLAAPDGGLLDTHSHDGVHLLASGFNAWAKALHPFLSAQTPEMECKALTRKEK